jgi:cytochrome P450
MSLFSPGLLRNPFPLFEQMRLGPKALYNSAANLWMVFDYEGVKRVLTDHEWWSSAVSPTGVTREWLIFADPPRHTKLRALISRAFTPRVVADLEHRIRARSAKLLDPLMQQREIDLVSDFAVPLPLWVIADMLGLPEHDFAQFRVWSDVILGLSHSVAGDEKSTEAERAFRQATAEMRAYLATLLGERRRAPADDLLTRLAEAEVSEVRLDDDEILGFFQLLLVAGHETTTNLISNAIISLVEHPDELARLRASPELIASAVEEVLRFRSPVQASFRTPRRDVELHGHTITAGTLVLPMIGSANRDSRFFEDAERFDVGRAPNLHLAFGHGLHFCIGASLSRLEARIALTDLLGRMKAIELETHEWQPREAFHVHGPARLPIRFTPAR